MRICAVLCPKVALADMSKPVYRHMLEQRWREEGALDLLVRISALVLPFRS